MDGIALKSYRVSSIICMVGAFGIYLLTLAPTVQGFDSAELTVGAYTLGFVHAPGYPLYMLLGYSFSRLPFGDVGLRLNLMSAVFASLTVLILSWTVQQDSEHAFYEIPVVWLFATVPIFWSQAVRAEVYTLHTFLMIGVLYLWRRAHQSNLWSWYIACFVLLGLGMGNHLTSLLLWGTLLICLIWQVPYFRWLGAVGTVLGLIVAGMLYLYFPLRSVASLSIDYVRTYFSVNLRSVVGVWWLLSAKMFQPAFYLDHDWRLVMYEAFQFVALLWDNFLGVGFILGIWGWWRLEKREPLWNRLLSIYFIANLVGFVCYHVVDKEVMFIPAYAVWSVWMANGVRKLSDWLMQQVRCFPPRTVNALVHGALLLVVGLGAAFNWRVVSLHDNWRAYDFAVHLLENVEPSTLIANHWVTASVLDYLQIVEGRRPDVQNFNVDFYNLALQERHGSLESVAAQAEWYAWLEHRLSQRPICFIEPLPAVPEHYQWIKHGVCWKLVSASQNYCE